MRYREIINEEAFKHKYRLEGDDGYFTVINNPSKQEFFNMFKKSGGNLRALISEKYTFIWPAYEATHDHVLDILPASDNGSDAAEDIIGYHLAGITSDVDDNGKLDMSTLKICDGPTDNNILSTVIHYPSCAFLR